ncbi:MAG: LptA/OstA family protein [Rhodovibrionaceae bacterium]
MKRAAGFSCLLVLVAGFGLAVLVLPGLSGLAPAAAQVTGLTGGNKPLRINADQGIEWRRDQGLYLARGNASVVRGDITVRAQVLRAYYRESGESGNNIYRVEAEGGVRIETPGETASSDSGVYHVDRGVAVLRGDSLRLETDSATIVARDSLEYWEDVEGRPVAVARGQAVATRGEDRVEAEVLTASLSSGGGNAEVVQIDASGGVTITRGDRRAEGERAVYYVDERVATLHCNVWVTQGENRLNGQYAEFNLETGVSRITPDATGCGGDTQVRGLFQPE